MKKLTVFLILPILFLAISCSTFEHYTIEDTKEGKVVAIKHVLDWLRDEQTEIYFSDGHSVTMKGHWILSVYGNYQFMYYNKQWNFIQSLDYPTEQPK